MHPFFEQDPEAVAQKLLGKVLKTDNHLCLVNEVLPQFEEQNIRWQKCPLFRKTDPADVYVANYRGSRLLFLRTREGTCVRINKIEIAGLILAGPGKVCQALELAGGQTGDLDFDGTVATIQWHL